MPPKGSKRAAPDAAPAKSDDAASSELRRSTRGGGHKAPEPKAVKPRSKKAKTTSNGDDKGGSVEAATAGEATADPAPDAKTDGEDAAAKNGDASEPVVDGEKVPEENKDAEKAVEASKSGKIEVGQQVPDGLVLKNEADEDVTISELTKEKGAVFFVYPKANTPGCTTQACDFRDNYAEFGPLGYDVYGLSADSPKSQSSWKTKHNFPYHLLCDPGQVLTKILGAAKSGTKSNQRSHFIVAKGGKLVDAKYTISPKDSCKQALEFIKSQ